MIDYLKYKMKKPHKNLEIQETAEDCMARLQSIHIIKQTHFNVNQLYSIKLIMVLKIL